MAATGGRMPFDQAGALAGPARVLYADPDTESIPADLYDVVPGVNDGNDEYPAQTGWTDFGLAADAPSYVHSKDTEGLEYQQSRGVLFETISSIQRQFTVQVAEISPANLKILENTAFQSAISGGANEAAQTKVEFGVYQSFQAYRVAFIMYRPDGSATVEEPDGTKRPPAVALILPRAVLAAEDTEFSFEAGTPVNAPITFTCLREPSLGAGKEHGFWIFETPGIIT